MSRIFITILNMSLTASYCIVVVMALRLLLKKQPKLFSYLLWSVVLFRMLCPFSISGSYSLLRMNTNIISMENITGHSDVYTNGKAQADMNYNNDDSIVLPEMEAGTDAQLTSMADAEGMKEQMRLQKIVELASWIWLSGIILLVCYSMLSTFRLRRTLDAAVRTEENLYEVEEIDTPFVLGIINPRIYLPSHLQEEERKYVLAHERIHIARKDYLIKLLAYAAVCLHWFNPLVWLAFALMENDMEMSCDEAVLKKMGLGIKEGYSRALLSLSTEKAIMQGCPIAFGEGKVKGRVLNILAYRKKALFTAVLAAMALVVVGIGLVMNPKAKISAEDMEKLTEFVENCAEAVCNRDGAAIVDLYVDEDTALAAEEPLLLEKAGDGYTYGWSSPWPFSNEYIYQISAEEGKAEIWLYAMVSDPHIFVWKKEIRFTKVGDEYLLTGSSIRFLDNISSKEEFDAAYSIGEESKFVNFVDNEFVESISYQMENENLYAADNTVYEEPETAAAHILNLIGGTSVDEGSDYSDRTNQTVVRYTFADGSEVDIPMCAVVFPAYQADDEGDGTTEVQKIWIVDTVVWNAKAP